MHHSANWSHTRTVRAAQDSTEANASLVAGEAAIESDAAAVLCKHPSDAFRTPR